MAAARKRPHTPHPQRSESLQQSILAAYQAKERRVVLPPGIYRIPPPPQGAHLQFHDMSAFEIDASGAEFIFTDPRRGGIEFRNCREVRLRGAKIRYEIPPFTQGALEAIAPDGTWYDIRIDKGYPSNLDDPKYFPAAAFGNLFDPRTRSLKPGTYDLNGTRIQRKGADRFRLYWNRPLGPDVHPVAAGDLVSFRGSGTHNVTLASCAAMTLDQVTIYNAGAFAVGEFDGRGANHYAFSVERGPAPAGASSPPLLSSTADAFHSARVRNGPVLENCRLENMGDDGIAIHGTYSLVLQVQQNRLVINRNSFAAGDPLRLLDSMGRPAGETLVKSARLLPGFRNVRKSRRKALGDETAGPYVEIVLERPLDAKFDDLVFNPAASGSGYTLRGNTIRNHRARGMLLKADHGVVEGNTIDGSSMGGIVLSPEFWWNEGSYSHNVSIRNNTIRHVAYAPAQFGGVVVATTEDSPVAGCGHQNIVIEANRFEDIDGVNLLISSACDVTVRGNRFVRPQRAKVAAGGASWGEDAGSLIFVTEAKDIRFEDNTASEIGRFNHELVTSTASAHVEGARIGVTSAGRRE